MLIASYNVQNLFERASALSAEAGTAGAQAVEAQAEINVLLRKPGYEEDRERIGELLVELGLAESDEGSAFAMLRQNRGRLVKRPESGGLEVVAKGRADWVGWVELKTEPTDEQSTRNTARVIKEVDADVLGVVEAENRRSLRDFSRVMLRRVGGQPYEHSMVIDGNDDRGIDVGLMTKEGFEFDVVRTHIFELDDGQPLFSRDCVEYLVRTPSGTDVLVLVNHFKSKRGGGEARRGKQARRVAEIVRERLPERAELVVLGDLNDSPDSDTLRPLLEDTPLRDVSESGQFDDGGFPGTFDSQRAEDKFDYALLSPRLFDRVEEGGTFRKGVFTGSERWEMFDTIEKRIHQASDHAAVWARIEL